MEEGNKSAKKRKLNDKKSLNVGNENIGLNFIKNRKNLKYVEVFAKQTFAIKNSTENGSLPIFAKDTPYIGNAACKKYVTGGYDVIWDKYFKNQKDLNKLNFYEIMLPELPCHLYVDSEIYYEPNHDRDLQDIHKKFKDEVLLFMKKKKYIKDIEKDVEIIELDSSNDKKMSIHYVFKIVGKMFKNNFHCGEFMIQLEHELLDKYSKQYHENPFFFVPEKTGLYYGDHTPIYDSGVYTTYRVFRTYGCSKAVSPDMKPIPKPRPLLPMDEKENRDLYIRNLKKLDKSVWLNSLVQYIDPDIDSNKNIQILLCQQISGQEPTSKGRRLYKNIDHNPALKFHSGDINNNNNNNVSNLLQTSSNWNANENAFRKIEAPNNTILNHPAIKCIFDEIRTKWKDSGMKLKLYSINKTHLSLLINSDNSTSCKVKGTYYGQMYPLNHKTNHIYFVVDLRTPSFKQGCHDKDESCFDTLNKVNKFTMPIKFDNEDTKKHTQDLVEYFQKEKKQCNNYIFKFAHLQKNILLYSKK